MKLYKGFDKNMQCRGFQFEEGKTYIHDGEIKLCEKGFHACENPLDCFNYYSPAESIYREVEMEGISSEREEDSKVAGKSIKIGARISFGKIAQLAVEDINSHIDKSKKQQVMEGNYSAASNTGNRSVASNTGNRSVASSTGDYSVASNTGYFSVASNTGNRSAASNTGNCSVVSSTGDYSAASNTGNRSVASSTGYCSAAEVSGKQSVALAIGKESRVRGALGCWIVCAEWDENGIKDVQCVRVDGGKIKPDVWYTLKNSAFVED